jgi:hypothetical protein
MNNIKLTSAQDAIKQAIEGGYNPKQGWIEVIAPNHKPKKNPYGYSLFEILTDPLFWQALGKARGWKNSMVARKEYLVPIVQGDIGHQEVNHSLSPYPAWFWYARLWMETRMSGGDETELWESLP